MCSALYIVVYRENLIRTLPEAKKSSVPYKFAIDYDKKRIRSISLTSLEKKIQNCPPLKKNPPKINYVT